MSDGALSAAGAARPFDPAGLWQAWWRSLNLFAPLSGDVDQTIDAALVRAVGDQLGFVNINATAAGDPDLERRITEQVASYGRQLGRILDALDVVIRNARLDDAAPEDRHALDQFNALRTEIEAVKKRAVAENIDRLVAEVRTLRRDPEANRDALRRLREALGD
jgi:Tetratrico peptide repeat